jgi:hypothetical protein
MIRYCTVAASLSFALSGFANAQTSTAAQPPRPYELKNRSTFAIDPDARTPFWPIGWKKTNKPFAPAVRVAPTVAREFQIQPQHFIVSSVLLGNPPLATINGRAFGEGETLPVVVGGQPVRVVVKGVRDGGVWLDQSGHQIFVPLRRQELPTRTPDIALPEKQFQIEIPAK